MRHTDLSWAIIIPARYRSSRFPGKPLAMINGVSLIERVWLQSVKAVDRGKVYIATDDTRICDHVKGFGGQVIMTSSDCLTGTDRVFEAAQKLGLTNVINIQGDEPLIQPETITAFIDKMTAHPDRIINGMAKITVEDEFRSPTVPKVIARPDGRLMYMSRAAIPTNKSFGFETAFKQVCIYAFPMPLLAKFVEGGKKQPMENIEDIEILRFLEINIDVDMIEVSGNSLAVDVPGDILKVESALNNETG